MTKKLKILKSLIDPMIIHHFKEEFDIMNPKEDYEFKMEFVNEGDKYTGSIMYKVNEFAEYTIDYINGVQVTDVNGLKYSPGKDEVRQEEHELIICTRSQTLDKKTVQQEIEEHVRYETDRLEAEKRKERND